MHMTPVTPDLAAAKPGPARRFTWLAVLALAGLILLEYGAVARYGFVYLDDDTYVAANRLVQEGLTLSGIRWSFTTLYFYNWHPLTWLSYMLDCQLFGCNPGALHLVNLFFHLLNSLLLFYLLRELTGRAGCAWLVAALFAVHPLHVESVAWIAERKDVLSTFFGLGALLAYTRYARQPSRRRYLAVAVLLILGLLAKPMLVTWPVLFLLLDFWPLRRWPALNPAAPARRLSDLWPLIREKIPFFLLSFASSLITIIAQNRGGAIASVIQCPLLFRFGNALLGYCKYLEQAVWPFNLAVFYPYRLDLPLWQTVLAALFLAGITVAAWQCRKRQGWFLTGWLWYLVTLLPVIGLIQVGGQARADRYTYIPLIGIFLILVWAPATLLEHFFPEPGRRRRAGRALLATAAAGMVIVLTVLGRRQVTCWRDSLALFRHAIDVTGKNYLARTNLGIALRRLGRCDEALAQYEAALRDNPRDAKALYNAGIALAELNRLDEATAKFREALAVNPGLPEAEFNLGMMERRAGRPAGALPHFLRAIEFNPDYTDARIQAGVLLRQLGRLDEAVRQLQAALATDPGVAEAHFNLGVLAAKQGRFPEAADGYRRAVELNPRFAEAHYNWGVLLLGQGDLPAAEQQFRQALATAPEDPNARINLGITLARQGQAAAATAVFAEALQRQPDDPELHFNLANAQAAAGRMTEALASARRALTLAESAKREPLANQIRKQIRAMESATPPKDPAP